MGKGPQDLKETRAKTQCAWGFGKAGEQRKGAAGIIIKGRSEGYVGGKAVLRPGKGKRGNRAARANNGRRS